jgi:signal transduction histidine kinase
MKGSAGGARTGARGRAGTGHEGAGEAAAGDRSREFEALGAALVVVDLDGTVIEAPGWEKSVGSPPPARIPSEEEGPEELLLGVAAALEEGRRRAGPCRRMVTVELDRKRCYSVAAGPLLSGHPAGRAAAIVMEITDALEVGPREGDAMRQLTHDLRTPLTSISGATELLVSGRLGRLTSEQAPLLEVLQKGLQLMLSLIGEASARAHATQAQDHRRGKTAV